MIIILSIVYGCCGAGSQKGHSGAGMPGAGGGTFAKIPSLPAPAPAQNGWGTGPTGTADQEASLKLFQHSGLWFIRCLTQGLPSLGRSGLVSKEDGVRPFLTHPWKSWSHSHHRQRSGQSQARRAQGEECQRIGGHVFTLPYLVKPTGPET